MTNKKYVIEGAEGMMQSFSEYDTNAGNAKTMKFDTKAEALAFAKRVGIDGEAVKEV